MRWSVFIQIVGNLIDGDFGDWKSNGCGLQRERAARGHSIQIRRAASFRDERFEVFELAVDRVRKRIATIASAATREVVDAELCAKLGRERLVFGAVIQSATNENDRLASSVARIADPGPILRLHPADVFAHPAEPC